jgi:hypothetical protein
MLRVRVALVALFLILLSIPFLLPLGYAYTMWLGESAFATVTECRPAGKSEHCRGTWVGSDGRRHSGWIEGSYSSDIGHRIKVRIGPLGGRRVGPLGGVQKESISGKIVSLAMLLGFGVVAPVGGIVGARRFTRRLGAAGRALRAAAPAPGMIVLVADRKRIWRRDGPEIATLRPAEAPSEFTPPSPPGRAKRERSGSVIEAVRWLAYNPSKSARYVTAYDPGGTPLFTIYRAPSGPHAPETLVLDPGGGTRALIRRAAELPPKFVLLTTDGRPLGGIEQTEGLRGPFELQDEPGHRVGLLAHHGRTWVLHLPADSPLRDLALAFAVDASRLCL